MLEAYADGRERLARRPPGRARPRHSSSRGARPGAGSGLAGLRPEPWTPVDTLTWAKVQAWGLGGNMDTEIFRMLVDARLGDPALTDELFPAYAADRR